MLPSNQFADELYEKVDHPAHYGWIAGVECIDVIEHMDFCLGSAIKYIWRVNRKPAEEAVDDLRKAVWYLEREISRLEKADDTQ